MDHSPLISARRSRRAFLSNVARGALMLPLLAACGGGAASTAATPTHQATARASAVPTVASAVAAKVPAATPTISAALAPITVGGSGGPHHVIWWPYGSKNLSVDQSWEAFGKENPTWAAEISYTNGMDKFLT